MIAGTISDVKDFMNQLLVKDTFDTLLLCEATLRTATTLSISGKLNMDFFDTAEQEVMTDKTYAAWRILRPLFFEAVKGTKTPSSFKIIFMLPKRNQDALVLRHNLPISPDDIAGLYFNLYFDDGILRITSGLSMRIFTTDKCLEQIWDDSLMGFLGEHHIHIDQII